MKQLSHRRISFTAQWVPLLVLLGAVSPLLGYARGLLTVATGEVRVGGVQVRAPVVVPTGVEVSATSGGRAVIFFPETATEFEISSGAVLVGPSTISATTSGGARVTSKARPAVFRSAKLDARNLVQAGGQFKLVGVGLFPNRHLVLPFHTRFSWPIADREGSFRFRLLSSVGEVLVDRAVDALQTVVDTLPLGAGTTAYRWEVSWSDSRRERRVLGAEFGLLDQSRIAEASTLRASLSQDPDGLALFQAWAMTQMEEMK